jgi:hypothetical protein
MRLVLNATDTNQVYFDLATPVDVFVDVIHSPYICAASTKGFAATPPVTVDASIAEYARIITVAVAARKGSKTICVIAKRSFARTRIFSFFSFFLDFFPKTFV